MANVMYLCDGEKPDCNKKHCYKNISESPCRHTSDIEHAINFAKRRPYRSDANYWESSHDEGNGTAGNDPTT